VEHQAAKAVAGAIALEKRRERPTIIDELPAGTTGGTRRRPEKPGGETEVGEAKAPGPVTHILDLIVAVCARGSPKS
jgi:hypothetical protein